MKRSLVLLLLLALLALTAACGDQTIETAEPTEPAQETVQETESTQETEPPAETEPAEEAEPAQAEAPSVDEQIALVQGLIDQPVDQLYEAIGQPNDSAYASSCIGEGEDGELYYDGFTVYTYRDTDGSESVYDVMAAAGSGS